MTVATILILSACTAATVFFSVDFVRTLRRRRRIVRAFERKVREGDTP